MWVMILKLTRKQIQVSYKEAFNALYVGDDFETQNLNQHLNPTRKTFNALYVGDDFETRIHTDGTCSDTLLSMPFMWVMILKRISSDSFSVFIPVFQCPLCG